MKIQELAKRIEGNYILKMNNDNALNSREDLFTLLKIWKQSTKGGTIGDITNDQSIKKIYIKNAIKLCNSNNYQCICTHDFSIINNLDIYKNKNLELSFYYRNFNYVKKNIKKY